MKTMEKEAFITRRQLLRTTATTVGIVILGSQSSEASPGHSTTGNTDKPLCTEIFETKPGSTIHQELRGCIKKYF